MGVVIYATLPVILTMYNISSTSTPGAVSAGGIQVSWREDGEALTTERAWGAEVAGRLNSFVPMLITLSPMAVM